MLVALLGIGVGVCAGAILRLKASPRGRCVPWLLIIVIGATVLGQNASPILNIVLSKSTALKAPIFEMWGGSLLTASVILLVPSAGLACTIVNVGAFFELTCDERSFSNHITASYMCCGTVAGLISGRFYFITRFGVLGTTAFEIGLLTSLIWPLMLSRQASSPMTLIQLCVAGLLITGLRLGYGGKYNYGWSLKENEYGIEFFESGASADVRVLNSTNGRVLEINGLPVSGPAREFADELSLAYFPRLLRPDGERVLVLGLGSGQVCGASLLFPKALVTCGEEEQAVVRAMKYFGDVNYRPDTSASFRLVAGPFSSEALFGSRKYDLILINYGNAWLRQTASLMTSHFYTKAKKHLNRNGLIVQRLALGSFSPFALGCIARTVVDSFPHYSLIRISSDTGLLTASQEPLIDFRSISEAQSLTESLPSVHQDLVHQFGTDSVRKLLVAHVWLNEDGIRRLAARDGTEILTDERAWGSSAFLAPGGGSVTENSTLINRLIANCATPESFRQTFSICGGSTRDGVACHYIASIFHEFEELNKALQVVQWGLTLSPGDPVLLADRLIWAKEDSFQRNVNVIAQIEQRSKVQAFRVGVSLIDREQFIEAIVILRRLTEMCPKSPTVWATLARAYQSAGDVEQAGSCLRMAADLDPIRYASDDQFDQ